MVISAIGTQCIGKSTFIKDFIAANSKFILPDINYRKVIEKNNLRLNRDGNYRSQRYLFDFMQDQVIELAKDKNKFYIVDRSLIDVVAYSMWLYENKPEVFTEDQMCRMFVELFDHVKNYDFVIYIPLNMCNNVTIEDDKFRDTNIEYREYVDNNFKYILNTYSKALPEIVTIYGNRTERVDMLKKKIPSIF